MKKHLPLLSILLSIIILVAGIYQGKWEAIIVLGVIWLMRFFPKRGLKKEDVQWIVNDSGELGVMIGGRKFFLFKGESLEYNSPEDPEGPKHFRLVGKREFGECCISPEFLKYRHNLDVGERMTMDIFNDFGKKWQEL